MQKLIPVALPGSAPGDATQVRITGTRGSGAVDALVVMPEIATLAAAGGDRSVLLLTSKASRTRYRRVTTTGRATATVADRDGRTVQVLRLRTGAAIVPVTAGGFTLIVG